MGFVVIDAHKIRYHSLSVKRLYIKEHTDPANTRYADSINLLTDQKGNLSIWNRRLTGLAPPPFDEDAVTLRLLLQDTVFKVGDLFIVGEREVVNEADDVNNTKRLTCTGVTKTVDAVTKVVAHY